MKLLAVVSWFVLSAVVYAENYAGTYEVLRYQNGKKIDPAKASKALLTWMELGKDGRFTIQTFDRKFSGNWTEKDGLLRLISDPRTPGKDRWPGKIVLKPSPNRGLLKIAEPKALAEQIEFKYDPGVVARFKKLAGKS
ncbi:MAG TPA: hypothetical protein PLL78_08165 [Fimbriimonadaceae bacterium]|nr:hypothetical protein [Fimbriimonadaceae bacterium]HRJ96649.1 hypothetical protein [Fimbriimonadaceae bacterium]